MRLVVFDLMTTGRRAKCCCRHLNVTDASDSARHTTTTGVVAFRHLLDRCHSTPTTPQARDFRALTAPVIKTGELHRAWMPLLIIFRLYYLRRACRTTRLPRRGEQLQRTLDEAYTLNLADAIELTHGRDVLLCTTIGCRYPAT